MFEEPLPFFADSLGWLSIFADIALMLINISELLRVYTKFYIEKHIRQPENALELKAKFWASAVLWCWGFWNTALKFPSLDTKRSLLDDALSAIIATGSHYYCHWHRIRVNPVRYTLAGSWPLIATCQWTRFINGERNSYYKTQMMTTLLKIIWKNVKRDTQH